MVSIGVGVRIGIWIVVAVRVWNLGLDIGLELGSGLLLG